MGRRSEKLKNPKRAATEAPRSDGTRAGRSKMSGTKKIPWRQLERKAGSPAESKCRGLHITRACV